MTGSWRKSSYSGNEGECVETARFAVAVGVRDSKDLSRGVLELAPWSWDLLVSVLKAAGA